MAITTKFVCDDDDGEGVKAFVELLNRGLSQEDIAKELRITKSAVSQWRQNKTKPDGPSTLRLVQLAAGREKKKKGKKG
jgi:transcriptional regulator with XRE-family HTH domain